MRSGLAAAGTRHAQRLGVATAISNPDDPRTGVIARPRARVVPALSDDARQAPLVLGLFVLIQLLDGVLTYWGVTRFGIDLEMNGLLSRWMHDIGPATTLLVAKSLACACGLILYRADYFRALAAVAGLCLGVAVIPWAFLVASIG
jgi:hypothetical protein